MATSQPSRRDVLRLTLAGAGAGVVGATGLATQSAAAVKPATDAAATIMIIRHAEKPPDSGKPHGVMPDGDSDDKALTVQGWQRAGALVGLFAPTDGALRAGLTRPTAIYAAKPGDDSALRPNQTVTPLCDRMGLTAVTTYAKGDEEDLAGAITALTGAVLVSWQHESIADIVANLGTVSPTPPSDWPDERYDMVWVFTPNANGYAFTQVPELLLAGDSADPI